MNDEIGGSRSFKNYAIFLAGSLIGLVALVFYRNLSENLREQLRNFLKKDQQ